MYKLNFRIKFTINNYPSASNFHQWDTKFQFIGEIHNLNSKAGTPKCKIKRSRSTSENIEAIKNCVVTLDRRRQSIHGWVDSQHGNASVCVPNSNYA